MRPLVSLLRSLALSDSPKSFSRPRHRQETRRLHVEALEDRTVPSAISITDATVREGPTSTGILDPSGGVAVGLNGPREIIFDNAPPGTPGYQHAGDLFVTGYLSHSVARFDWATQTYQPFVAPDSGGLGVGDPTGSEQGPRGIAFGPDGNVYVSDSDQDIVYRYDGATGAPLPAPGQTGAVFIPAGSGGLTAPAGITFGADGNLYVCSYKTNQILRYQGPAGSAPGAFVDVFASVTNVTGATGPNDLTFGPDGNLYVGVITGPIGGQIDRFAGSTGAPIGSGIFVPDGSGGLVQPRQIVFDPTGANMYVVECRVSGSGGPMGQVLRYQGPYGQNPGAFVEPYITGGQGGLNFPIGLVRDAAGILYVSDKNSTANVTRFAPSAQASFVVTLDSASTGQISVNYAAADGTAVAGTDYTQTSGTLVFSAGVTSETINVPITTVLTGGPTKTFTMNLSGASGATISRGQGIGSILNRQTKFFVANGGTSATYEYGSGGTSEEITPESSTDTAPRGVATTAAGDRVWVVDANKNVYVYTNHGVLLGSWSAGGLNPTAQVEGVATNGTDVWLLDAKQDKVFRYAGGPGAGANRLSGNQNPASSFALSSGDKNPKDIVTDGTSLWVVDDGSSADKVFKYTLSEALLGSWTIDAANAHPTGITINPNNVSDIWIVDSGTLKVYQYVGATSRTSGSQNAAATFALNPNDTNPQGIADPPPADMLLTLAPVSIPANLPESPSSDAPAPSTAPTLAPILSLTSTPAQLPTSGGELVQWTTYAILTIISGQTGGVPSGKQPSAVERDWTSRGGSDNWRFADQPMAFAQTSIDNTASDLADTNLLCGALVVGESQAPSGAIDTLFAQLVDHAGSEE
jgi:sugar lactone lactonase YvrE